MQTFKMGVHLVKNEIALLHVGWLAALLSVGQPGTQLVLAVGKRQKTRVKVTGKPAQLYLLPSAVDGPHGHAALSEGQHDQHQQCHQQATLKHRQLS